jgi:hypothetical protein
VDGDKVALPGYWDSHGNFWNQDAYQVGTATGNVGWAALLMLTVYEKSHDPRYLQGALAQLGWVRAHTLGKSAPEGYEGGLFGYDNAQRTQHWKSTEHNIDIYAAARWALTYQHAPQLAEQARIAGTFVKSMWSASQHRFYIGTLDDGKTISREKSGLDSQVWPLLAFRPMPPGWSQVWAWVTAQHRSGNGYGYRRHPDGSHSVATAVVTTQCRRHVLRHTAITDRH